MPVVQSITMGGTIASRIDPATGAAFPVMHAAELLNNFPELATMRNCESRNSRWCPASI